MATAWESTGVQPLGEDSSRRRFSLARDSVWSLVAQLAAAAVQWAPLVVLARWGEPALVGRYAFALALVSPPLLLTNLQLRPILVADVEGRSSLAACLKLRSVTSVVATAVLAVVAWTAGMRGAAALEVAFVAGIKILEQWSDLHHAVLQKSGRLAACAAVGTLKFAFSMPLFALAWKTSGSLWLALAAVTGVYAVTLGYIEQPLALRLSDRSIQGSDFPVGLAWRALPLGVVVLMISLTSNLPRWFIERRQGLEALGYFAALSCFPTALHMLAGAVAQAATARLAADFRFRPREFARLTVRLSCLVTVAGLAAVAACHWSSPLLAWLYQPVYTARLDLLAWLMAAGATSAVTATLGTALTAAGVFRPQATLYGLATIICAACCFLGIDARRPASATMPLLASAAVVAAGQIHLLRRSLAGRL